MKALVFLLVVANLLFYAFAAGYFGHGERPDEGRLEQQIKPERMRIVSRGEPPAGPAAKATEPAAAAPAGEPAKTDEGGKPEGAVKPEAAAKPEADSEAKPAAKGSDCVAWDRLSIADADKLTAAVNGKFADFKLLRRAVNGEGSAWWVYIPPLADKAEADKKAGELRGLGVTDFFPIQEGPNRLAISLGVFTAEKGALERLADLKARGVRSARQSVRPGKEGLLRVEASGPAAGRAALVAAVAKALPKADAQGCK